jgi:chromosome segregation and condensation protein ScpB
MSPTLHRSTSMTRECKYQELCTARPYEIVFVAGGFQFRTRPRHAETLRALTGTKDAGPPSFTKLEMLALSAIAYQQPVTRAELSRLVGHDISRDILGRLKSLGVIAPGPRAPMPGAPIAWVTTARFLEFFALGRSTAGARKNAWLFDEARASFSSTLSKPICASKSRSYNEDMTSPRPYDTCSSDGRLSRCSSTTGAFASRTMQLSADCGGSPWAANVVVLRVRPRWSACGDNV